MTKIDDWASRMSTCGRDRASDSRAAAWIAAHRWPALVEGDVIAARLRGAARQLLAIDPGGPPRHA